MKISSTDLAYSENWSTLVSPSRGLTTGQLLEHYRGTNNAATLEKLSMWDDIADKNIAEQTFTDSLNHMFDSLLELRRGRVNRS